MINTQVDQAANNAINQELNKGIGGVLGDVDGLIGGNKGQGIRPPSASCSVGEQGGRDSSRPYE